MLIVGFLLRLGLRFVRNFVFPFYSLHILSVFQMGGKPELEAVHSTFQSGIVFGKNDICLYFVLQDIRLSVLL